MQYYKFWVYELVIHTFKMYSIYSYKILAVLPIVYNISLYFIMSSLYLLIPLWLYCSFLLPSPHWYY